MEAVSLPGDGVRESEDVTLVCDNLEAWFGPWNLLCVFETFPKIIT